MEHIRAAAEWFKPVILWVTGLTLNIPNSNFLSSYLPDFMLWGDGMDIIMERGAAFIGLIVLIFTARLMYIRGKKAKLEVKMLERKANQNYLSATNEKIAEQQKQIEALQKLIQDKN